MAIILKEFPNTLITKQFLSDKVTLRVNTGKEETYIFSVPKKSVQRIDRLASDVTIAEYDYDVIEAIYRSGQESMRVHATALQIKDGYEAFDEEIMGHYKKKCLREAMGIK